MFLRVMYAISISVHHHLSFCSPTREQRCCLPAPLVTAMPASSDRKRQRTSKARWVFWITAAGLLLTTAREPLTSSTLDSSLATRARSVEFATLPGGLRPTGIDSGSLVCLVAADIDGDGDLDVVAADGSLRLIVWTNDGSGHLRRQAPRQTRTGWQPEPGSPTLEHG